MNQGATLPDGRSERERKEAGRSNLYSKLKLKQNLVAYGFLAIPLILLAVFTFYPLLQGIYISFMDYQVLKNPTLGGPVSFATAFFGRLNRIQPLWPVAVPIFGVMLGIPFYIKKINTKWYWMALAGLLAVIAVWNGNNITKSLGQINYAVDEDQTVTNDLVPRYLEMLKEQYGKNAPIVTEAVNPNETRVTIRRPIWCGLANYNRILPNPQFAEFVKNNPWYIALLCSIVIGFLLLNLFKQRRAKERWLDVSLKTAIGLGLVLTVIISWPQIFHSQTWPFYEALKNTLKYVLVVPPIQIASILLAILVNQKIKGITFFRTLYYVPVITGVVIIGYCWKFVYQPNGLLDSTLAILNLKPLSWLGDRRYALYSIMFVTFWRGLGYYMVLYLAGLQDIPNDVMEAARIDGANLWQTITRIYLPLLRRTILVCTVLSTMAALRVFEEIYVMSAGSTGSMPMNGTVTLVYMIYDKAFGQFGLQFSYSAALAVILSVFIGIFTVLSFRLERRDQQ